jgi:hypothetical protein
MLLAVWFWNTNEPVPLLGILHSITANGETDPQYDWLCPWETPAPKLGNPPNTPTTTNAITITIARIIRYSVVPCPFLFINIYSSIDRIVHARIPWYKKPSFGGRTMGFPASRPA